MFRAMLPFTSMYSYVPARPRHLADVVPPGHAVDAALVVGSALLTAGAAQVSICSD